MFGNQDFIQQHLSSFACAVWCITSDVAAEILYWDVNFIPDHEHDEPWFINKFEELLFDSVDYHLVSDVEVGSYVSGGIDSSLMAALAREEEQ